MDTNNERRKWIPLGQKILIGKPAKAPSEKFLIAIKRALESLPTYLEAHLPQYFAIGAMSTPRLALVLVIDEKENREVFAQRAEALFFVDATPATEMDLWVLAPNDPLLPNVRRAACTL
jgi:hypothetical protein